MISRLILIAAICLTILLVMMAQFWLAVLAYVGGWCLATTEAIVADVKAGGGPPCRRAGIIANNSHPAQPRTDTGG